MKHNLYEEKLEGIRAFIGENNTDRLLELAELCIRETGDRIMGKNDLQKHYDAELFIACSTNIDQCFNAIKSGIRQWQDKYYTAEEKGLNL
ncbi:unnamed protein product [marine sediment metagenome]|uniref:Uncharacterized protein n=1 Tax=marine sediment metagenome TaxID=412755 RepID=X0VWU6_9ZZZZ